MLVNPFPYCGNTMDRYKPLNNKPWPNMKQGSKLLNLVDADMLVYAAGFAIEHCDFWVYSKRGDVVFQCDGKDRLNRWMKQQSPEVLAELEIDSSEWIEPFDKSGLIITQRAKAIVNASRTQRMNWYLTKGSTLWRNEDAKIQAYKGNRVNMRKPQAYDYIREYMTQKYRAKTLLGLEADDGVAAIARENPGQVIVTSGDKDLKTIPGLHLSPTMPAINDGVIFISELQACRNLYVQMLMGDRIDNIKGLSGDKQHPGWGPVKSRAAMAEFICEGDMADYVARQYEIAYPDGVIGYEGDHLTWQEMLCDTANLLFLRRYRETQFIWEP
jgi:hypothetical protein